MVAAGKEASRQARKNCGISVKGSFEAFEKMAGKDDGRSVPVVWQSTERVGGLARGQRRIRDELA